METDSAESDAGGAPPTAASTLSAHPDRHSDRRPNRVGSPQLNRFEALREHSRCLAQQAAAILGSPTAFAGAAVVVLMWILWGPAFRFSSTWQLIMNTAASVVTCLAVFLVQSSHRRDNHDLQAKLDELLRAVKGSGSPLRGLDELPDLQRHPTASEGMTAPRSQPAVDPLSTASKTPS